MNDGSRLLKLQEADLELQRLKLELSKLPELVELACLRKRLALAREEMLKVRGVRKDLETDLEDLAEEERYYREQVDEAQADAVKLTDYRQVQDLEIELSNLAKALDKIAFDQKDRTEKLQQVLDRQKQGETAISRLESSITSCAARAKEVATDIQEKIAETQELREKLYADLSDSLRTTYDTAANAFNGLGVETLKEDVPSLCRTRLMESSLHAVQHGEAITECPYCHRILVVETDDAS